MPTETVHYHYGRDSYRIQYDITQIAEAPSESGPGPQIFRVSLIRIKVLGGESPLRYFAYTRDFNNLPEAQQVAKEYSKFLVRHEYLKQLKKRNGNTEPP